MDYLSPLLAFTYTKGKNLPTIFAFAQALSIISSTQNTHKSRHAVQLYRGVPNHASL